MRAHPRGCGADGVDPKVSRKVLGSSPRVRGRLRQVRLDFTNSGLIPAGAGQTQRRTLRSAIARAHPRGCGADRPCPGSRMSPGGSSPRVRGRHGDMVVLYPHEGLIPAGAGQTAATLIWMCPPWAHPRGCGADTCFLLNASCSVGSSPRVRGRQSPSHKWVSCGGLIPAGAGQTPSPGGSTPGHGAHPRGCGADTLVVVDKQHAKGSSPRVRGRLAVHGDFVGSEGLIPAGAGQTGSRARSTGWPWAHPRGCGADLRVWAMFSRRDGSSPRVRGRLVRSWWRFWRCWLIPAGAGQTEHSQMPMIGLEGSSPRVRGRPLPTSDVALIARVKEPTLSSHFYVTPLMRGMILPPFKYGSSLHDRAECRS